MVENACKTCALSLYGMTIENKTQRKSLALHTDEYCREADVAKKWRPGHRAWVHYTNEDGCFLGYRERTPRKGVCLDTPRLVGRRSSTTPSAACWTSTTTA